MIGCGVLQRILIGLEVLAGKCIHLSMLSVKLKRKILLMSILTDETTLNAAWVRCFSILLPVVLTFPYF